MSSLLSTMAILLANYDEQRDYLSNFEPFVLDRLKAWPPPDEVRPKQLCAQLSSEFSLPAIPINTVTLLRDRVYREGYLRRNSDGKFFTVPDALARVEAISAQRTEVLAHFNALVDAVRSYASGVFGLNWSNAEAEDALERFLEEFGVEMAIARDEGKLTGAARRDEASTVVHSFARRALDRDPANLGYLEEMVKGSMLTNVIYFQDLGNWTPSIKNLVVYIDTPFALRALEVAPEEISSGALELLRLLAELEVPIRMFDHTVDETIGVLNGIKGGLIRARRGELQPEEIGKFSHETVEHLLRQGWGPGDVEALISDIDARLSALGATVESPPEVTRGLAVDENRFERVLAELGYSKEPQILKDVRSLTAIHRLRGGQSPRDLSDARAIFVTTNPMLVRASHRFFKEQGLGSPVPQCITDISLTTQLWLRTPGGHPEVPRKVLMAESYAALSPSSDTWAKYIQKIQQRREAGDIDDRQVKVLVLSNAAREGLLEVTGDQAGNVTDETPIEVLDRYGEFLKRPAEEAVSEASEHLIAVQRENEALRDETKRLRREAAERDDRLSSQDRQIGEQDKRLGELQRWKRSQDAAGKTRANRVAYARALLGFAAAACVLGAILLLAKSDRVSNPLPLAIYGLVAGVAAVVCIGWGFSKPWTWSWKVIVAIGVLGGLLGLLYGILLGESQR